MTDQPDQYEDKALRDRLSLFKYRTVYLELAQGSKSEIDKFMQLITQKQLEARIDELKLISKRTVGYSQTPENKENPTWQGGYNFARNNLKRYKLERITELTKQGGKG
jgi:hypothetical protein